MNASVATAEKAFKHILAIMELYSKNQDLLCNCISSVWSLCLEDDNEDMAIDQATPLIITSLKKFPSNVKSEAEFQSQSYNFFSASGLTHGSDGNSLLW